jgi:hypothetical protein
MDDELDQAADDLVTLTPDEVDHLEHRIARLQCAADALLVLARRPYFSVEQKSLILAETDELVEEDIEPLRAALRNGTLPVISEASGEELGLVGATP